MLSQRDVQRNPGAEDPDRGTAAKSDLLDGGDLAFQAEAGGSLLGGGDAVVGDQRLRRFIHGPSPSRPPNPGCGPL